MKKQSNNYFLLLINNWQKPYAALITLCLVGFVVMNGTVASSKTSYSSHPLISPIFLFIISIDVWYLYELYKFRDSINETKYKIVFNRIFFTSFSMMLFFVYYLLVVGKIIELVEFVPVMSGLSVFFIILTLLKRKVVNKEKHKRGNRIEIET